MFMDSKVFPSKYASADSSPKDQPSQVGLGIDFLFNIVIKHMQTGSSQGFMVWLD